MIRMDICFDSMILHQSVRIKAALPQSLHMAGGRVTYPSVFALHAAFNDADSFFERLDLLDLVEEKKVAVIAPSLPNSYFVNTPLNKAADFLDCELFPYLHSILPLSDKREDRTCLGVSMGAFGALAWGLRKPDFFSRLCLLSGYYDCTLPQDERLKEHRRSYMLASLTHPYMQHALFCGRDEKQNDADLEKLMREFKEPSSLKIDFFCGDEDYISLMQTDHFLKLAQDNGFTTTCEQVPGDHDFKTWRHCIQKAFGL